MDTSEGCELEIWREPGYRAPKGAPRSDWGGGRYTFVIENLELTGDNESVIGAAEKKPIALGRRRGEQKATSDLKVQQRNWKRVSFLLGEC